MALKPEYQQVKVKERISELKVQSVVECKTNQSYENFAKILSVTSKVSCIGAEALAGEVRYSGRVIFNLIYRSREGEICKGEYGAEFSHRADREDITPSYAVNMEMELEGAELKQMNGQLVLTAIVTATATFDKYGEVNFLTGGEGLICKTDTADFTAEICRFFKTFNVYEEFSLGSASEDILSHNEDAIVYSAQAGIGCVVVEGEIYSCIVLKTAEGLIAEKKTFPFRLEVEAEDSMPNMRAFAKAKVTNCTFSVVVDPDKNKTDISAEFTMDIKGRVYDTREIVKVTDAYSAECELNIINNSVKYFSPVICTSFSERIRGTAIGGEMDAGARISFCSNEKASVALISCAGGKVTAEGVASVNAFYTNAEGGTGSVALELPFSVELKNPHFEDNKKFDITCLLVNPVAIVKNGGEIEMEGTLKIVVFVGDEGAVSLIGQVEQASEKIVKNCAFSVYIPKPDDTLWELSKELGVCPETITLFNKDLQFPLKGDERIIIYRRKE